jgi:glutathione S-transferase
MKLYYSPGACSLSPHIILKELGLPYQLIKVDLRAKTTETGANFLAINPKGQIPTLELDSGEMLSEGVAIVQYLADLAPEKGLMPITGMARYRQLEWLNFISSELHKGFSPLFNPGMNDEGKQMARTNLQNKFKTLEGALGAGNFLMGSSFTLADAYLFTVLSWANYAKVELPVYLQDYLKRVALRPAVQAALSAEGLA